MSTAELSPRRRRRRYLVGYDEAELAVKPEPEEDIKDYAETTMNELLGWYGYEKVDSRDTQGLNLTHFASTNPPSNPPNGGVSPPSSAIEGSDGSEDAGSHHEASDGPPSRVRSDSASPGPDVSSTASDEVARQHQQMVSALSSVTKHPGAPDSPNLPPGCIVCAWCQKVGMKLFTLKTPNGCKAFCSELCFTQCRRASFKKNKICDWCKHVRHTVNYVDFQDGEQQLQFCSDKCLNQYKMNIFCKETQAHLQMHTHLKEAACKMKASGSVNLITPDLWLRDCKVNGLPTSPLENMDNTDDVNSDENISMSAIPSPVLAMETSRPNSPVPKEKKEQKQDPPQPLKERDKPSKKSSKHSPKKSDGKSHHSNKHYRDKKMNGMQYNDVTNVSRHSPIHASPNSHARTAPPITNGTPSLLSPPPLPVPRQPHHVGSLPPRHCPPPVPSPLGMGGMEPGRQPFMHPNMMPPPFQFLAQQQMEAILRSQHGLDLRSKPPPHLPMPPWVMPSFHPVHPPQPPIPPPMASSRSPSLPYPSPPTRTHHQNTSHKSSSHHSRHKHSKRSSVNTSTPHSTPSVPIPDPTVQFPHSLLPPVTVMVPFPLVLPVPLPIPIPLPIPPDIMEKYKLHKRNKNTTEVKDATKLSPTDSSNKKRKLSSDAYKHKRSRRNSTNESSVPNVSFNCEPVDSNTRLHQNEGYYNEIENLSIKVTESQSIEFNESSKVMKTLHDTDVESRSYSPLSDLLSSNEDDEDDIPRTLKNKDADSFQMMNFSAYNLGLRSSPSVTSQASDLQSAINSSVQEFHKSPSPTNLSVREKPHSNVSSSAMNFKKKHLREQLSLMT